MSNIKNKAPIINHEDIVDYIYAKTILDKDAINTVLNLEMEYLESVGIAEAK
jgi:hypothetical protein